MLILFDHGTPRGPVRAFSGHTVVTAFEKGWDALKNGELLGTAEENAVGLLLTTHRRMQYPQNLKGRQIAIVVLTGTTKWARVRLYFDPITAAVNAAAPGSYTEVEIPFR
jgi:hypothetical protein